MEELAEKERLDNEFAARLAAKEKAAEEKTARKRAKRNKKKQKLKDNRNKAKKSKAETGANNGTLNTSIFSRESLWWCSGGALFY